VLVILHQTLLAWATWPLVSILIALMLILTQGFNWRTERLGPNRQLPEEATRAELWDIIDDWQADRRPPDVRFGYTPDELETLFHDWGAGGRRLYLVTQLTLDLVFPLVYGLLFACLIVRTCDESWGRWLCLLPLALIACDYLENFSGLVLVSRYREGGTLPTGLVTVASLATQAKIVLFMTTGIVVLAAGVMMLRQPTAPQAATANDPVLSERDLD
jgi:hypothetical protein